MKCFTKLAVLTSVTGWIPFCLMPFWVMSTAAQTSDGPVNYPTRASASVGTQQIAASVTTTNPSSKPQSGFPDAPKTNVRKSPPAELFGPFQPAFSAIALGGKTTATATLSGLNGLTPDLYPARETFQDDLASPGLKHFGAAELLLPEQPAMHSFVSLDGKLNYKLFNSLVQAEPGDRALAMGLTSTRAWTTIVGWHPCESTFSDARVYEPSFDLFWIGAAPQR